MWAAAGEGAILAMVVFVVIGLIVGHVLGAPDADHSVVLAISSACRHPAIALSIASANFAEEHFGGTILLYAIVNIVVGLIYVFVSDRDTRAPMNRWREAAPPRD
jgi:BASS family bile acid:Na+ symporter